MHLYDLIIYFIDYLNQDKNFKTQYIYILHRMRLTKKIKNTNKLPFILSNKSVSYTKILDY